MWMRSSGKNSIIFLRENTGHRKEHSSTLIQKTCNVYFEVGAFQLLSTVEINILVYIFLSALDTTICCRIFDCKV